MEKLPHRRNGDNRPMYPFKQLQEGEAFLAPISKWGSLTALCSDKGKKLGARFKLYRVEGDPTKCMVMREPVEAKMQMSVHDHTKRLRLCIRDATKQMRSRKVRLVHRLWNEAFDYWNAGLIMLPNFDVIPKADFEAAQAKIEEVRKAKEEELARIAAEEKAEKERIRRLEVEAELAAVDTKLDSLFARTAPPVH
jgi:hypothetical protein